MTRDRIVTIVALMALAIAMVTLGACSSGTSATTPATTPATGGSAAPPQSPPSAGATVAEVNFAFSPESVAVSVGDSVSFVNKDSAPHDVLIDGQDLGQQAPGATVTWKATKAGTFPYSCTIHPQMKGQVVVK